MFDGAELDLNLPSLFVEPEVCQRADLTHDRFHVLKHLTEVAGQVRRVEAKKLRGEGETRLVGSRWNWLRNGENISDEWADFEKLKDMELKTGRSQSIKACFRWFREIRLSREEPEEYFEQWCV